MLRGLGWLVGLFIESMGLHPDRGFPYWAKLWSQDSPDREMFGVLFPLHLHPLYARGSFSAFLLRKVEKRLSGNRESTEGSELPAYAKHLSVGPRARPSPPESNATDGGEEWGRAGLTRKQSPVSCAVVSTLLKPLQQTHYRAESAPVFQGFSWGCCCLLGFPWNRGEEHGVMLQQWGLPACPQRGCVL